MRLIALLAGTFFKLADELLDTHHPLLIEYSEHIKTLCIVFTTLFFYMNIEISILIILVYIPSCFYMNQIDTPFWNSMIAIPFITSLFTYQSLTYRGVTDILEKCSVTFLLFLIKFLESKTFPEEYSKNKIIFRTGVVLVCIVSLYISQFFIDPTFICSMLYSLGIGYFGTSVVFKTISNSSE